MLSRAHTQAYKTENNNKSYEEQAARIEPCRRVYPCLPACLASPLTLTETNHCCANKKSMHCPYGVLLCAGHVLPSCDSSCLDAVLLRLRLRLELKLKLGSVDLPRFAQGVLAAFFWPPSARQIKFSAVCDMRRLLRLTKCLARLRCSRVASRCGRNRSRRRECAAPLLTFRFGFGFGNSSILVTLIALLFLHCFFSIFCVLLYFFGILVIKRLLAGAK